MLLNSCDVDKNQKYKQIVDQRQNPEDYPWNEIKCNLMTIKYNSINKI